MPWAPCWLRRSGSSKGVVSVSVSARAARLPSRCWPRLRRCWTRRRMAAFESRAGPVARRRRQSRSRQPAPRRRRAAPVAASDGALPPPAAAGRILRRMRGPQMLPAWPTGRQQRPQKGRSCVESATRPPRRPSLRRCLRHPALAASAAAASTGLEVRGAQRHRLGSVLFREACRRIEAHPDRAPT